MDKYTSLLQKLKDRQPVMMANIMVCHSPLLMGAFEQADCLLLDKEHGIFGSEELIPLTMQCRSLGLPTVVRVEEAQYHLVAKAIDMGADGIMVPRTETVEQVKTVVEAMHFYPKGRTGFGGFGLMRPGEDIERFNRNRVLLLQIESHQGLEAMEDMIAAYGEFINGFMIGPNDYSIMMGTPLNHGSPAMLAEYKQFYDLCHRHRMSCGTFDPDREHIRRDADYGANVFWLSDDFNYMKSGFERLIAETKDIINGTV